MPSQAHQAPVGRPLVYAHRGGAALRPENTLAAFDHGLSFGVDGLELDVHLSRDGVVVVHHDATLERTTNGRGPVASRTASELAQLDAGYHFSPEGGPVTTDFPFRGRGIGVPAFREVLARYPQALLIIELKSNDPLLAIKAIDEIRAAKAIDRVVLGAFGGRVLRAARVYEPAIRTGAGREETRWALYGSWVGLPLRRPAFREFQVPERAGATTVVTPRFVSLAHRANVAVKVWTVDAEDDIRRLLSWGVDGIITDRPDVAVPVVRGLATPRA